MKYVISILLFCTLLFAQTTGKIKGKVTDASGNPVADAFVLVDGTTIGGQTDENGYYYIIGVRAGVYSSLSCQHVAFKTSYKHSIQVKVGLTTTVNFKLEEGILFLGQPNFSMYYYNQKNSQQKLDYLLTNRPEDETLRKLLTALSKDFIKQKDWPNYIRANSLLARVLFNPDKIGKNFADSLKNHLKSIPSNVRNYTNFAYAAAILDIFNQEHRYYKTMSTAAESEINQYLKEAATLFLQTLNSSTELKQMKTRQSNFMQEYKLFSPDSQIVMYDQYLLKIVDHYLNPSNRKYFEKYNLSDSALLLPKDKFCQYSFTRIDSVGYHPQNLLKILQNRLQDSEKRSALPVWFVDYCRLELAYTYLIHKNRGGLLNQALVDLATNTQDSTARLFIKYRQLKNSYEYRGSSFYIANDFQNDLLSLEFNDSLSNALAQKLKTAQKDILANRVLEVFYPAVNLPDHTVKLKLSYNVSNSLSLKLYRITADSAIFYFSNDKNRKYNQTFYPYIYKKDFTNTHQPDFDSTLTLPQVNYFNLKYHDILLPPQKSGNYLLVISDDRGQNIKQQVISFAKTAYLTTQNNKFKSVYILDRISGKALSSAKVNYLESGKNKSIESDKYGRCILPDDFAEVMSVVFENDTLFSYESDQKMLDMQQQKIVIATDRPAYRPGQKICVKGIISQNDNHENFSWQNAKLIVKLVKEWSKVVVIDTVTVNDFNSFNCELIIPADVVNGNHEIIVCDLSGKQLKSKELAIEEYKLSRMDVELCTEPNGRDSVRIFLECKYLAGFPVVGALVKARAFRYNSSKEFETGTTDSRGRFYFRANHSIKAEYCDAEWEITDNQGDNQTGDASIDYFPNRFDLFSPAYLNKTDKLGNFRIINRAKNQTVKEIPYKITIRKLELKIQADSLAKIYSQYDLGEYYDRYFSPGEVKLSKEIVVENSLKFRPENLPDWPVGLYEICVENQLNKLIQKRSFTVYNSKKRELPYPTPFIQTPINNQIKAGEEAEFLVGTAYHDVTLFAELFDGHKTEVFTFKLDSQLQKIKIPTDDDFKDIAYINFFFINKNNLHKMTGAIFIKQENLKITLKTWRKELQPGTQEEWTVKVLDDRNKPVKAELLAQAYDAAVDKVRNSSYYDENGQRFLDRAYEFWHTDNHIHGLLQVNDSRNIGFHAGTIYTSDSFKRKYRELLDDLFDFDLFAFLAGVKQGQGTYFIEGGAIHFIDKVSMRIEKSKSTSQRSISSMDLIPRANFDLEMNNLTDTDGDGLATDQEKPARQNQANIPKIRINFNETAFFYPQIYTNSNGEAEIKFTLPDAITRWNFGFFAHTKEMQYGSLITDIISRKMMQIEAIPPRILRQGDKIVFSARVINLSDSSLTGLAKLELFDGITGESVDSKINQDAANQDFKTTAGEPANLCWTLQITNDIQVLKYRLTATSGDFTDGEEKQIPVLTDDKKVSKAAFITKTIKKGEEFSFDTADFINPAAEIQKMSLGAYYSYRQFIDYLPPLLQYPYGCAEQTFSKYYGNCIAEQTAVLHPELKSIKAKPASQQINNEIMSILQEANVFTKSAKTEIDLSKLFSESETTKRKEIARNNFKKYQKENGGFSWYGGEVDYALTAHLMYGFAKLRLFGCQSDYTDNEIIRKGVAYLKSSGQNSPNKQIAKLFAIQILDYNPPKISDQEIDNLMKNSDAYSALMLAAALKYRNNTVRSEQIVKEVTEKYYNNNAKVNSNLRFCYHNSDLTAMLLFSHKYVLKNSDKIEALTAELKSYYKPNNYYQTKQSAEMIIALLYGSADSRNIIPDKSAAPQISLNDQLLQFEEPEIKGYFKKIWSEQELKKGIRNLSIINKDSSALETALAIQYLLPLDSVKNTGDLKINKKYFLKDEKGNYQETVENLLKKGDRIKIVLEIESNKQLSYVHLKDNRCAALEPVIKNSGRQFSSFEQSWLNYYQEITDAGNNFFIDYLPQGKSRVEYECTAVYAGEFSDGMASVYAMYQPETAAYVKGKKIIVK